jgi:cupin fold WbuC family metalloprotein
MIRQARSSERRRAIYNYHHPAERLQRMLNAGMRDTYVAPHVHDHPRKLELFVILRGSVAVVAFDKDGNVADCVVLSDKGPLRIAEIPAGTWHSFVVLTPSAVVYELVDGRYDPRTHKRFAPWAPDESDTRSALAFLKKLRRQVGLAGKKPTAEATENTEQVKSRSSGRTPGVSVNSVVQSRTQVAAMGLTDRSRPVS